MDNKENFTDNHLHSFEYENNSQGILEIDEYSHKNKDSIENIERNECLKEKCKKNIYLASSVICTLATGVVGVSVSNSQKQKNILENGELESSSINNKKQKTISSNYNNSAESTPTTCPVEVVEDSSTEPQTEEDLKKAIEIAKAKSLESQQNAPVQLIQPEQSVETIENIEELEKNNIEYYSYNLEAQSDIQQSFSQVVVGQAITSNNITNAMRYWNYFEYYGYTYGIDPYLLVAMASQESRGDHQSTIPGGKYYNGAGYGIMQIEKPGIVTKKLTAYNHVTKSYEIMYINSPEDVRDVGLNIKAGAMQLAQKAKEQQYNPYVTIQGYNYGTSGIKYALSYYIADGDLNKIEEIYGNGKGEHLLYYIATNNQDWINKPTSSGLTAREWYSTNGWRKFGAGRGDKEYIERVMKYYSGSERPYILKDTGERVNF